MRSPLCTWMGNFDSSYFLEISSTIEWDWPISGTETSKNVSKLVSVSVLIGKINKIGIGIGMLLHLN